MGLFPLLGAAFMTVHLHRVDPERLARRVVHLDRARGMAARVHPDRLLLREGQRLPAQRPTLGKSPPDEEFAGDDARIDWPLAAPATASAVPPVSGPAAPSASNLCTRCSIPSQRSLQATLTDVRGHGTLTEADINSAMREIRLALLEADVNFQVVKSFTSAVKERALGADVIGQLNPGQQVIKIVNDELTALMGGEGAEIEFSPRPPTVILMAGLQGSGKTTATAKLARYLREQHNSSVAVAACDVYRPAAVEQLIQVGQRAGADVYEQGTDRNPVEIAAWARDRAQSEGKDVLIVDTSGRLHVDAELMKELADIKKAIRPNAVLLVVDAMTGQDAVHVAEQFGETGRLRRRDHEQARRRRPRRCRAVGQGDHRQADHVRLDR